MDDLLPGRFDLHDADDDDDDTDDDDTDDDDTDDDTDDDDDADDDDDDDDDDSSDDDDDDSDDDDDDVAAAVDVAAVASAVGTRDDRVAEGPAENSAYGRLGPAKDPDEFDRFVPGVAASRLPDNVSYEYLFGPVEDQGDTPACVTFALTAMLEALVHKHTGEAVHFSKRALYSLAKHRYEDPDQLHTPGLYEDAALRVFRDLGHVLENDYPFGRNPTLEQLIAQVPDHLIREMHDIGSFQSVELDPDHLMAALHAHGPLLIGMPWHRDWDDLDQPYLMAGKVDANHAEGGHCTTIVGYSKTKRAFRLRNSWGTGWGDRGYAWLPMDHGIPIDDVFVVAL